MKEILARIFACIKHIFCLFKLTISCRIGLGIEDEDENLKEANKDAENHTSH